VRQDSRGTAKDGKAGHSEGLDPHEENPGQVASLRVSAPVTSKEHQFPDTRFCVSMIGRAEADFGGEITGESHFLDNLAGSSGLDGFALGLGEGVGREGVNHARDIIGAVECPSLFAVDRGSSRQCSIANGFCGDGIFSDGEVSSRVLASTESLVGGISR
jgi:hypothetical protein